MITSIISIVCYISICSIVNRDRVLAYSITALIAWSSPCLVCVNGYALKAQFYCRTIYPSSSHITIHHHHNYNHHQQVISVIIITTTTIITIPCESADGEEPVVFSCVLFRLNSVELDGDVAGTQSSLPIEVIVTILMMILLILYVMLLIWH